MGDLIYAERSSLGFSLKRSLNDPINIKSVELNPRDAHCRCMTFSNNGRYFAYCDSIKTAVLNPNDGSEYFSTDLNKTNYLLFSPNDNFLVTYEPYVVYGSRFNEDGSMKVPNPNLRFWRISDGSMLASIVAHEKSMARNLPQFTEDESVAFRIVGSELLFYTMGNFERFTHKKVIDHISSFLVSPGKTPYLAVFIPPIQGKPAAIQLRLVDNELTLVTSKISFNCDKCTMIWNKQGTAFLAMCSVDVDKTNQSYYGTSHLFCLSSIEKYGSFTVHLDKHGPIYCTEWVPSGKEFAVCFGYMPSRASVFNMKGETVWDLGEGHRNEIHFNKFSTIMAICGFGNISSGKIQLWDMTTKEEVNTFEVPHTTHFSWIPDGKHFCTSTQAPRLRTDNGYTIWSYEGALVYEKKFQKDELWQVEWSPCDSFAKFELGEKTKSREFKIAKILGQQKTLIDKLPSGAINKKGVYIPPGLRKQHQQQAKDVAHTSNNSEKVERTEDEEIKRKIKNLQKKLDDINKLKERAKYGEKLEKNQEEKVRNEMKLREELEDLRLSEPTIR